MRPPAIFRLVHPAPAFAVTALSAALASILTAQSGAALSWRTGLIVLAVAGSQVTTGATNDLADLERDRGLRPAKPLPAMELSVRAAVAVAGAGVAIQLAASIPLGVLPTLLGVAALGGALAYNFALSRSPLSVLPYLASFGILPVWIASAVDVPLARVLPAMPLAALFAAAAHLANTLRDWDADAAVGSRNLGQTLGRPLSHAIAIGLGALVALAVAGVLVASGRASGPTITLGALGLGAVLTGTRGADALWTGMLVAAVCWTAAWALATG